MDNTVQSTDFKEAGNVLKPDPIKKAENTAVAD